MDKNVFINVVIVLFIIKLYSRKYEYAEYDVIFECIEFGCTPYIDDVDRLHNFLFK